MIRRHAIDAICLALLVLIAVGTGHLILTTALAISEITSGAASEARW